MAEFWGRGGFLDFCGMDGFLDLGMGGRIGGCLKLVTINCYNVTTLQHLFVVKSIVTTLNSCKSIILTHDCCNRANRL